MLAVSYSCSWPFVVEIEEQALRGCEWEMCASLSDLSLIRDLSQPLQGHVSRGTGTEGSHCIMVALEYEWKQGMGRVMGCLGGEINPRYSNNVVYTHTPQKCTHTQHSTNRADKKHRLSTQSVIT